MMTSTFSPNLSHCGVFVRDLERMVRFYCDVFDMQQTDCGQGITFDMKIAFLSAKCDQHHQLALATGRAPDAPSTVMQLSFKVDEIEHLRETRRRALANGATAMRGLNHGNALSIYFSDPEGNTVEAYLDTPWQVRQPHGDPLDLDRADAEIWAETERTCRADPTFEPASEWSARFEARQRTLRDGSRG
ncbi:MAG: VOC family protein [Lautropia sp.]